MRPEALNFRKNNECEPCETRLSPIHSGAPLRAIHVRMSLVIGGVETVLCDWMKHFEHTQVDAKLVCFANSNGTESTFLEYVRRRGLQIGLLPWGKTKSIFRSVASLLKMIRTSPLPCVLHSHDVRARLVCTIAGKLAGVPHVASMHGWHNVAGKVRFLEAIDSRLLRFVDVVANCSEATRSGSIARGVRVDRAITLYNGIDFSPFETAIDREKLRRRFGFGEKDIVVGNVARLYPEKGQGLLLQATAKLLKRHPTLKIVIFGEGPELPGLIALRASLGLEQCVSFPGFEKDLAVAFGVLDIYAMPSLAEGMPQVICGAMAMGLPIAAYPVDGIPEVLEHERTALLPTPGNVDALASSLDRLISEPGLARRLGESAKHDVRARLAVQNTIQKLEKLYQQLLFKDKPNNFKN